MQIFIKSAGKGSSQDYNWFNYIDETLIRDNSFELDFKEDLSFYYKNISKEECSLYLNFSDNKRLDNWGRKIKNHIYLQGTKEELRNYLYLGLSSIEFNKTFLKQMENIFLDSENPNGFIFDKKALDALLTNINPVNRYQKIKTPFFCKNHTNLCNIVSKDLSQDVIKTDYINDALNIDNTIFISSSDKLNSELKRYHSKKALAKKSLTLAGLALIVSGIITIIVSKED